MPRFIALLRGINVGGNKKVPMAQLRAVLEGLGHTGVATLLQSGNAVFTSKEKRPDAVRRALEAAIEAEFGFHVDVVLRTRDELEAVIAANPLEGAEREPSKFLVLFASARLPPPALDPADFAPDEFTAKGRELYARFPNGMGRSRLAAALMSPRFSKDVILTGRNWATVKKLLALADAG